jgi:hypothetical protein
MTRHVLDLFAWDQVVRRPALTAKVQLIMLLFHRKNNIQFTYSAVFPMIPMSRFPVSAFFVGCDVQTHLAQRP